MIHIDEEDRKILCDVLSRYPYTFYAFGSRVKGTHWKYSDLDICYKDPIPSEVWVDIDDDLRNSNLPFKVDVVAWQKLPSEWQKDIEKDLEVIPCAL